MTQRRFSFEFFPPKTAGGRTKLEQTWQALAGLGPDFFSVTYGAGGSTRDNTRDTVLAMRAAGLSVAPHLSFGTDDDELIRELLTSYADAGVDRIVALRGDLPSGMGAQRLVYAEELVRFVRTHFGRTFHIEVAAYPEIHPDGRSYDADIGFLKRKFDAGADSAITQYFYNVDAYFRFVDACARAGIDQPIVPGIMPITNFTNLARFSRNCGAEIPRWLAHRLAGFEDGSAALIDFGTEVVAGMCEQLLQGGAPGLHFYSMNQVEPVTTLWRQLDLPRR